MDDWQKTIDALVKAFDEFAVKVKEMADALAEAFGFGPSVSEKRWQTLWLRHSDLDRRYPKTKEKKSLSSPARYGMSLQKSRRDSFVKQYSYRPIARKHLPYQRRNY
ncbi:MAG: hypothetical protein UGF91_09725 [Dialister invisus]|nr:hypothetical protein [Dialister invisus]